jgi:hypothetical protein
MSTVAAVKLEPQPEAPKTPSPGVYFDIDEGAYNSWQDSARSSVLKKLLDSTLTPAHVRWEIDNPKKATPALILGRLCHTAILEPERFMRTYARGPDVNLKTNIGKDEWAKAEKDNPGKELLRYHDWMTIEGMVESIWKRPEHEHVRNLLLACPEREVSVVWIDEATGVKCRARIDALGFEAKLKADLKTTGCAAVSAFESSIPDFGYHVQAALYQRACDFAGWDIQDSLIIALEKEPPFLATSLELTGPVVAEGDRQLKKALEIYAACENTGTWPGYEPKTTPASFPTWYWHRLQGEGA